MVYVKSLESAKNIKFIKRLLYRRTNELGRLQHLGTKI